MAVQCVDWKDECYQNKYAYRLGSKQLIVYPSLITTNIYLQKQVWKMHNEDINYFKDK